METMTTFITGWTFVFYVCCLHGFIDCQQASPCNDVDTAACSLILASKPDLCRDQTLSATCRRFCGICPLVCYDCPTAMSRPDECNTTKSCNQGEVCMRKEHVTGAGLTEYIMSCEAKTVCEGMSIGFHVGKRQAPETYAIQRRDLAFKCCEMDLCNWPANFVTTLVPTTTTTVRTTTTTTLPTTSLKPLHTCARDIVFVLDGSSTVGYTNHRYAEIFVDQVTSHLRIGAMDSLVSLVAYSGTAIVEWYLPDYPIQRNLHNAIYRVPFIHGSTATHAALWLVRNAVLTTKHGERPNAKNIVVLITDGGTDIPDLAISEAKLMHADGVDVIAVGVGHSASEQELRQIIRPAGNYFSVQSYHYLRNIQASLTALICK